jgi:hypothetical protein
MEEQEIPNSFKELFDVPISIQADTPDATFNKATTATELVRILLSFSLS